ncbi:protein of unknown function (plasmid) [Caballeronia sp. S22]
MACATQIHSDVVQTVSRTLKKGVRIGDGLAASRD